MGRALSLPPVCKCALERGIWARGASHDIFPNPSTINLVPDYTQEAPLSCLL